MADVFVILDLFSPTDPPNNLKNQNFEKMTKDKHTKVPTEITMCSIHENHMMYGS